MEQKEISIYNSIATAEGLIAEMIFASPENLQGCKALILGYGTCAKTIAAKLKGLHLKTCICARNEAALMEAYTFGHHTEKLADLKEIIKDYPLIINTIPYKILKKDVLEHTAKGAILFEIASYPYGIDMEAAQKLHINAKLCMSLPAKYAPVSSAEILTRFILKTSLTACSQMHAAALIEHLETAANIS